jgi:hypothetical protein
VGRTGTKRIGSSDGTSAGSGSGSIPGSSTEKVLARAPSFGQFRFPSASHQDARLSSPSFGEEALYARIELDEHLAYDLTTAVMAMNARADDAQEGVCVP